MSSSERAGGPDASASFTIVNDKGMHARAAAKLAQLASRFTCEILVSSKAEQGVNAKSVRGVLLLVAAKGSVVHVEARGDQAEVAVAAIGDLIEGRFGEPS